VQAVHLAERHEQHALLVEPHGLGEHRAVAGERRDAAQLAEPHVEPRGLDHEADHARHLAVLGEARHGA
jgi:hypothetical protein